MSSSQPSSPVRTLRRESHSLEETSQIGQALGALLFPGAVIALIGPLGAGKTWFTRSVAQGLGLLTPDQVTSPTFVLIQEYAGRMPIYHFDVYRLTQLREFEDLGALEYLAGDGVCLLEWADRVAPLLPTEYLNVELELTGAHSRTLVFTAQGERYAKIVDQLSAMTT